MTTYLKSAKGLPESTSNDTRDAVQIMLAQMRTEKEAAAIDYAKRLDGWDGEIVVSPDLIAAAADKITPDLRAAIDYAHDNIRAFAVAQRASISEFETELRPGLWAGQRVIPVSVAGCYVPGGRYAHIASALMTITTAKAAGVETVIACSPPRGDGIDPAILYTMGRAGADRVLCIGGVQGVAAMAFGMFGNPAADILVGPGNHYVAEAKRQLFGPVGIDMIAGPTDSMICADATADAMTVAWDLVGQAEHGYNSPVWLVTTHRPLAERVIALVPAFIAQLPEPNRANAAAAWDNMAEVMVVTTREEMAQIADQTAPEHLHIQATDLDWWKMGLRAYGSLFLGANTTVAFGDKAAGPNHVLPTSGAARYTGGLSVHKFLKTVTWQRVMDGAVEQLATATATISRAEGMEGHARTADIRLPQPPAQSA